MQFSSRKPADSQKKDTPLYKKQNLNHTDYAYREAVNRLKVSTCFDRKFNALLLIKINFKHST